MGNVLYIDKPKGYTSFDVCNALRKVFKTKKIGHTGTLDPLATGVLIILLDKATKANQFLVSAKKEYLASVEWGKETDTLDCDGKIVKTKEVHVPSEEEMLTILKSFIGDSIQIPPLTSAIKINGKKLYEYQRQKIAVEIPPRNITVYNLDLINLNSQGFCVKAQVSSGTYIRSLVRDIALKSNNLATLVSLRRLKVDDVDVNECDKLSKDISNYHLHNLSSILTSKFLSIDVGTNLPLVKNGKKILLNTKVKRVFLKNKEEALAIYELREDGYYHCVRGLF